MEQLQQWLKDKCVERNLSWREASIGSGLNPGAVSAIVGGQRPGLDSCKALAKFFRVSPILILQLAGHIEKPISSNYPADLLFRELADAWPDLDSEERNALVIFTRLFLKARREEADGASTL